MYGLLATSVRQRTAEIGMRMALGAAPSRIFRLMVGKGLYLSVIGIGIGLLAALALTRVLTSMLVEVKPTDPVTFVFVSVLFPVDRRHCFMASGSARRRIRSDHSA
jgi:putative ABC transport system permease protein